MAAARTPISSMETTTTVKTAPFPEAAMGEGWRTTVAPLASWKVLSPSAAVAAVEALGARSGVERQSPWRRGQEASLNRSWWRREP